MKHRSGIDKLLIIGAGCILSLFCFLAPADAQTHIIVDQQGKGDFRTIQAAINSLPDSAAQMREIDIHNGVYKEKLFITKDKLRLVGQSRKKTIITASIARDIWRCDHSKDWGVATMNISGSDITLKKLTVINSFGFDHKRDTVVNNCAASGGKKIVRRDGHQMALRTFQTTRLKAEDCAFLAYGGDTVSPWNTADGMFYFKDCIMEGGVDFYCPRGWAWAENCTFICHSNAASIWHDGSGNIHEKSVLVNCNFKGDNGFKLGRFHHDAQFFLINCRFGNNMADAPIYHAASGPELKWGKRVYYYNCYLKDGKQYSWMKNNLAEAESHPQPQQITPSWVFEGRWSPDEKN